MKILRRILYCFFDTHCRPVYISGEKNDIGSAGYCEDCGTTWEEFKTPPMPKVRQNEK